MKLLTAQWARMQRSQASSTHCNSHYKQP